MVALVFLVCCSYSYTEIINGQTTNANKDSLSWTMTNVLPAYTGLTVNAVSYRYTTVKLTEDPMVVNVQNLNALGNGYIFRSKDDWTGLPGNTITKTVPTNNIPIQYWGNGEIKIDGKGEVKSPYVLYSYTYDTCFGTISSDPRCPNYKPIISETKYADPLEDEYTKSLLEKKTRTESEEDLERNNRFFKKDQPADKKKAELVNKTVQNSLITAEAASKAAAFESLNNIPNFAVYSKALPGGVYQETIKYVDKVLPDSRNRLRLNYSQESLHNKMVDLQYNTEKRIKND